MVTKRPVQICGWRLIRLLVFLSVPCVLILTYSLNYWTISVETSNSGGSPRLHIVTKLNWTRGGSTHKDPENRQPLSLLANGLVSNNHDDDDLLSAFDVNNDRVNDINVSGGDMKNNNTNYSGGTYNIPFLTQYNNNSANQKSENSVLTGAAGEFVSTKPEVLVRDYVPNVHVTKVNCAKIIAGDDAELFRAQNHQNVHPKVEIPPEYYTAKARDCQSFIHSRHYTTKPLSTEEAEFPLAYSLLVFKEIELVERLLRAIYRPQNYYCIHVDVKATHSFKAAVSAIVKCFENVFLSSRSVDVQWGYYSVLEPEIVCMEDLWKYKKWKYFINLTGQEFPLKTNEDIVKVLKSMNGANNVHGTVKRRNRERVQYVHQGINTNRKVRKGPPPVPVTITKGSLHVIVQRGYVDFVLHNKDALAFREWVKDTGVPDETFFSSLNYSPQLKVPGAYKGEPETDSIDKPGPRNPFFARFKNWGDSVFNWKCSGKRVRMICVLGVGDLPLLATRRELFANKFHLTYNPIAYDCLEELHYNQTRDSVLGTRTFDTAFYAALDPVNNHVT